MVFETQAHVGQVVPVPSAPLEGRDEKLRALVLEHHAFIWRALRRLGVMPGDVDDALQKVYLTVASKLSMIVPGKERAFLFGIAVRIAANERRAQRRAPESVDSTELDRADAGPNPEELLERQRERAVLDEVLEPMPLDLRTVFVLFELEGMSTAEIASLTDTPAGTVASRLRRARECFETELGRFRARRAFVEARSK